MAFVPIYGTKDAGRGLWLRLKNTCKQFEFSLDSTSTGFVHASKRVIKDHCRDVFQCVKSTSPTTENGYENCVLTA